MGKLLGAILLSTRVMQDPKYILMDIEMFKASPLTPLQAIFGNLNSALAEAMKSISSIQAKIMDGPSLLTLLNITAKQLAMAFSKKKAWNNLCIIGIP